VKKLASSLVELKGTRLKLGIMCTIGPANFVGLLGNLQALYPGIELEIFDAGAPDLQERLLEGAMEAAIYCWPDRIEERLHYHPLFREQFFIVLGRSHRLATRNAIRVADLNGERYLNRINCEQVNLARDIFASQGTKVERIYRSERDDWILAMASAGLGFAFMPQYSITEQSDIVVRPLIDTEFWREVSLVTVRGRPHSPAVGAFVRAAVHWREREDLIEDPYDQPNAEELRLSDKVICASTFTMRSIDWIGVDCARVRVIPYGSTRRFDRSLALKSKRSSSVCRALFVGSGVQRKGLHLLLRAWAGLNCAKARLTVVWRNPEPGLITYARSLGEDTVAFKENISSSELAGLYAETHLFLLPSLVEGFGHVILEALTAGCFTIATEGTCLPDLQPSPDYAMVVPIGEVEALKRAIVLAIDRHYSGDNDYEGAIACSQRFTWRRFRHALCEYLV
jgi:DNA-binding transcriptional LysR family regulator